MTKDVLVFVQGMQFLEMAAEPEEPIEILTPGTYYYRNGCHYIKYEEVIEGIAGTVSSMVKIRNKSIEVRKRGSANLHMIFEKDKKNITYYDTPFGKIQLGVFTTGVRIEEQENLIELEVDYSLDMNDNYVADCCLKMKIQGKPERCPETL